VLSQWVLLRLYPEAAVYSQKTHVQLIDIPEETAGISAATHLKKTGGSLTWRHHPVLTR